MRKRLIDHLVNLLIDIGKTDNNLEAIEEELDSILLVIEDRRIQRALHSQRFPIEEKKDIIREITSSLKISQGVSSLLTILLEDGRLPYLREILKRYVKLSNKILNQTEVIVKTAIPLKEGERQRLVRSFEELIGCKVRLKAHIDKSIIGGVVIRIGDRLIDGSIKSSLNRLRQEMSK